MTVTLTPAMAERLEQVARAHATSTDTLVEDVLNEYLDDYLEELGDIAEAREQDARLARGETRLISMEQVHADIMAMDDMHDTKGAE